MKLTEGDDLKRAAVLLFHEDPERFVTGAFAKIVFSVRRQNKKGRDVSRPFCV